MAKKRKLSNFTTDDRSAMLLALQHFQETLDPEDEELPTGIHDTLNQLRQKLELVKVRYNTYTYFIMTAIDVAKCTLPSQKLIQPFSFKSISRLALSF